MKVNDPAQHGRKSYRDELERDLKSIREGISAKVFSTQVKNDRIRIKPVDIIQSAIRNWNTTKIYNDASKFPKWKMNGYAFWSEMGFKSVLYMNPWKVPRTIEGWKEADRISYNSPEFMMYMNQLNSVGEITDDFNERDNFIKLLKCCLPCCQSISNWNKYYSC